MYDLRPDVAYTTTTLAASMKGRNKRGLTLSKPDRIRTRRAKRQNTNQLGSTPYLRKSIL